VTGQLIQLRSLFLSLNGINNRRSVKKPCADSFSTLVRLRFRAEEKEENDRDQSDFAADDHSQFDS